MENKFPNPWSECEGFIDLGYYQVSYFDTSKEEYYELYAIEGSDRVDFGAVYGYAGEEYLSGAVFNQEDIQGGSAPILMAMARYYKMKAED